MIFITLVHGLVCILLVVSILMQSGRGGGLTEAFSSAESMFGAKTNIFMVRITSVLATVFLVTSLTLAYLSAQKEQSLIPNTVTAPASASTATTPETTPSTEPAPVSTNAAQ